MRHARLTGPSFRHHYYIDLFSHFRYLFQDILMRAMLQAYAPCTCLRYARGMSEMGDS